jgi:hypothetical protein
MVLEISNVVGDHYPRNISQYVPAMAYAADVVHTGPARYSLGTPKLADPDGILDGKAAEATVQTYTSANWEAAFLALPGGTGELDAVYGRNLTAVASAGALHVVTVTGRDYLGQVMVETITLNETTPVAGKKAFKYVDRVSVGAGEAGDTFDLGWGDVLGLPYKTSSILREHKDGVGQSAGTFVQAVLTDPQTATTGDPRGTYDPTATLDGIAEVDVIILVDNSRNAAGNGGLHGIAHFKG